MALKLKGSTSGFTAIDAPAVAGDNTLVLPNGNGTAHQVLKNSATAGTLEYGLTLPSGNGSSGQYLQSDGAGGSSWQTVTDTQITRGTAATLSSSGAIYTGLPSGIRRITMTLWNVSMDATSDFAVRIGDSGGIESSGYTTWNKRFGGSTFTTAGGTAQSGFLVGSNVASGQTFFGHVVLTNPQDNDWVCTSWISDAADNFRWQIGKKGLSGELDRIQIDVWSTNNFNGGSVNIFYEV
jgi:hypothetical protein